MLKKLTLLLSGVVLALAVPAAAEAGKHEDQCDAQGEHGVDLLRKAIEVVRIGPLRDRALRRNRLVGMAADEGGRRPIDITKEGDHDSAKNRYPDQRPPEGG